MAYRERGAVYLCCASRDSGFAHTLELHIRTETGAPVLIGCEITRASEVIDRIRDCSLFVLIWSSKAFSDSRCAHEMNTAARCNKRILTVICDDAPLPDSLRFGLDLHEGTVIEAQNTEELDEALRRALIYDRASRDDAFGFADADMPARGETKTRAKSAQPKQKSSGGALSSVALGIVAVPVAIAAAPFVGIGALVKGAAGFIKRRRARKSSEADPPAPSAAPEAWDATESETGALAQEECLDFTSSIEETVSKASLQEDLSTDFFEDAMPLEAEPDQSDGPCFEQAAPPPRLSNVRFSALAPERFTKGRSSKMDVVMYEESFRSAVEEVKAEYNQPVQETRSGVQRVREETKVRVALSSPDLEIDDGDDEQTWYGEHLRFSFIVDLPTDYAKPQIRFTAQVYFDGVPATRLKFIAECDGNGAQQPRLERTDINSGFMSYASQDRARVATLMQGMQKVRPELDLFFDVENLRSGENWREAIKREIDKRDALFLCWSHYSKQSEWVDMEWRYALERKGESAIEPVPIEPPSACPPPEALSHKHFNDKLLVYMNGENGSSHAG